MAAIVVHGGAGAFRETSRDAALAGVREAAELGSRLLRDGAAALDVVERVVNLLEDNPVFDAGRGSFLNAAGEVEMDALIVDGSSGDFGSVAAIQHVDHPISVARKVMESTSHCMLAGAGATAFAHEHGFPFVATEQLAGDAASGPDRGTVGAVVLDGAGHFAAGTSTGGTREKLQGRVGDSPLIGCGGVARDGIGAVSGTGHGESLMKIQMARTVLEHLRSGQSAQEAADAGVRDLANAVQGKGGCICIDASGRVGLAHNTPDMASAWAEADGTLRVQL